MKTMLVEDQPLFRERLASHLQDQIDRFHAGAPVAGLIRERSDFLDETLGAIWERCLEEHQRGFALVAVGGYGRRELHPFSDIDLLILIDESERPDLAPGSKSGDALSAFLGFLWDIGLKIGQSVRTVPECVEQAQADQTVMTNLLEARLIRGEETPFRRLLDNLSTDSLWPSVEFFEAKRAEQAIRHTKYHDTAYNLEPNIKEGPGGLRDIQTLEWIIKRHYKRAQVHLVQEGWLTQAEFTELLKARDFLWEIRFALHAMTGRCEDRLLFEYQQGLARQFGVRDEVMARAVEQFMQLYYRTVMGIERLNELILQLYDEITQQSGEGAGTRVIDASFQVVNAYVEVRHHDVFRADPLALFRILLLLQTRSELRGIRASTIRLIRHQLYLIDDDFRADPAACSLFMAILRQPNGVTRQLRRMNRYGMLAEYLPAFGRVVGRMQYDLFHVYTVDEHTLFVVRNLRRFSRVQYRVDHPFCSEVFGRLEKPELLYLAGLMHDIGKGLGGDHSELGAAIADEFCRQHALSLRDRRLVVWLVRNHLLMSMTAQRKDINDPEVIHEFASQLGDPVVLDYLYLLTVADIRATNPTLWNSWRDALLKELYLGTRAYFRLGRFRPLALEEKIAQVQSESRDLLEKLGMPLALTEVIWQNTLNEEYFQRFRPDEVAWHTIALSTCTPANLPLVLLRPVSERGSAELFIFARDRDFIFALITGVLDQLDLSIFDARIITASNGYLLNSYHLLDSNGEPVHELMRQVQICTKLKEALARDRLESIEVQRREPRQLKHFAVPTRIQFHEDGTQRQTLLELTATDRPGLLSKIGRAFALRGVRLHNARISTIGSRAEDIFLITDAEDRPLEDPIQRQALEETLIELIGTA